MEKSFAKKVKNEIKQHIEKSENINSLKFSYSKIQIKKILRKKFVKYGIISDPKIEHHLEYNFNDLNIANETLKELSSVGISGKLSVNSKNRYIIYIVDVDTIMTFLKLLGADISYEEYYNVVSQKSKIKMTNRKVNFETANIKKSVNAAISQIEEINKLLKIKKIDELDNNIREVVIARKKNPTLSLNELAEKMGNVSKSALNHRFIKIRKMIGST